MCSDKTEWRSHPNDYKLIAFTFDDAPCYPDVKNNITTRIIHALRAYDGKGTFFVIGTQIEKHGTALLEYAVQEEFEIENHTWSHANVKNRTEEEITRDIVVLNEKLHRELKIRPRFTRPAGLSESTEWYSACTACQMPSIGQTAGVGDWDPKVPKEAVYQNCMNQASDGAILLLHTYSPATDAVLPTILENLYQEGYRFVTLEELFAIKGVTHFPTDRMIRHVRDLL